MLFKKTRFKYFNKIALLIIIFLVMIISSQIKVDTKEFNKVDHLTFLNIQERVIDQLQKKKDSCLELNGIDFETCLLFQGSLGEWAKYEYADNCPSNQGLKKENELKVVLSKEIILRASKTSCFQYLYAINVARKTPILIDSATNFFLRHNFPNFFLPASDAELCIQVRYGFCGNHYAVAEAMLKNIGLKVRPIEFYFILNSERKNHITAEVYIDGDWRLIDTSYGAYWTENNREKNLILLSTNDLLAKKDSKVLFNPSLSLHDAREINNNSNNLHYLLLESDIVRGGGYYHNTA